MRGTSFMRHEKQGEKRRGDAMPAVGLNSRSSCLL